MPDIQDQLRTLYMLINDPEVDPQTRQEAQRRLQEIKRQPQAPGGKMALSKKAMPRQQIERPFRMVLNGSFFTSANNDQMANDELADIIEQMLRGVNKIDLQDIDVEWV